MICISSNPRKVSDGGKRASDNNSFLSTEKASLLAREHNSIALHRNL